MDAVMRGIGHRSVMQEMHGLPMLEGYEATCFGEGRFRTGQLWHVAKNSAGGATLTPVARYHCFEEPGDDGVNPHWRIDCYVRDHVLAPNPEHAGKALASLLTREHLCPEPLWVSWHESTEVGGEARGELWEP